MIQGRSGYRRKRKFGGRAAAPAWPDADRAFYEPPADVVAAAEPGEIIAAREVRLANLSVLPYAVQQWSVPAPLRTGQTVAPLQFLDAQATLAQGWAVVLPDHQGPNAAELPASYAPDLNVVGAAEGGIPAHLGALVDLADGNLGAGSCWGGVFGVSRDHPLRDPVVESVLDRETWPVWSSIVGDTLASLLGQIGT
ncbi:MAG: hypothetical protein EOP30_02125 [Rhodococcus sp. (in: high G+C Gram-positive bacteria)]|nr:MAG: hypothetical protein EOP30_02125 [Rhodococcus sp. (in: high G+C Gram-positive bacteria)]